MTHIHIVLETDVLGAVMRKTRQIKRICPSSNSLPNASATLILIKKKRAGKKARHIFFYLFE
jgi:hypothetical protein